MVYVTVSQAPLCSQALPHKLAQILYYVSFVGVVFFQNFSGDPPELFYYSQAADTPHVNALN